MSGDNYHFGDSVTMNGGRNNTGIVKNQAPAPAAESDPALEQAVRELALVVRELRDQLGGVDAELIDEALPALDGGAATPPQQRHRALIALAGIATTVGAVGQPALEAVNRVLALVSGQ